MQKMIKLYLMNIVLNFMKFTKEKKIFFVFKEDITLLDHKNFISKLLNLSHNNYKRIWRMKKKIIIIRLIKLVFFLSNHNKYYKCN